MTARKTPAARARALRARHPKLAPAEIARRVGTSPQAVAAALAVTHDRPGRPGVKSVTVRLAADLVALAMQDARVSVRAWIEGAIRARLDRESAATAGAKDAATKGGIR